MIIGSPCPYVCDNKSPLSGYCNSTVCINPKHNGSGTYVLKTCEYCNAVNLLQEQEKEIKALHLPVEWATDCDFGFDQFHDEYERYKDEIKDMKYIDGMIHVAKRTLEDHGAFEER